jgi:xanthine dehydrogenase YagR molybdenum-binding subunit
MTTLIGPAVDRIDGHDKVVGDARYGAEIPLEGLVHAVLVTSTIARGRVSRIDTGAAERSPGVLGVFTHENLPRLARQPVWDITKVTGMSFAPLQGDAVHFAGQAVAIVVAGSLELAQGAAELVDVEYEIEAPVATLSDAQANDGVFDVERILRVLPARYSRGDLAAGVADAAHVVRAEYALSAQRHHPIELASTMAAWDGDQLTVWETTQGVSMTQWNLADALGISPRQIRVISHYLGGSFGCKGSAWPHTWLVAQIARLVERPVKLVVSRDQMSTTVGWREEQVHSITLAGDTAGNLTGLRHVQTSTTSPFDDFAEPSCNTTQMLYACANVETAYRLARVNAMTPVFMRGTGGCSGCYAVECALDELAHELSIDPVELRLRNHADVDPRSGARWSTKSLKRCYEVAAARIGWAERDPRPASMRREGLLLGYGMASAAFPVNPRELTEVRIRLFSDGTALVQCGAQDIGTGTYTVVAQVAAEELALDIDRVFVNLGDTDFPRVGNSTGATTAAAVSSAVALAARGLRERIIELAVSDPRSGVAGVAAEDVTVHNGELGSAGGEGSDSYGDVLLRHQATTLDAFSQWDPASGVGSSGGKVSRVVRSETSSWSFGAWFVVVSVDPALGLVRVERMSGAWAAGRILNRRTAESQMRGGGVMGIGQALLEASTTDRRTARLLNPGLNEYLIPTHADAPPIDATFVEEHDTEINPLGVKGIGELAVIGAAPAIANAVFHATGRRIRHLPIRPEDLL